MHKVQVATVFVLSRFLIAKMWKTFQEEIGNSKRGSFDNDERL